MTASGLMTFSPELNAVHMYVQVHSAGAIVICKCLEMHCEEIAPRSQYQNFFVAKWRKDYNLFL